MINGAVDKEKIANRNGKAQRKARSRGVSGCSSKKDGGRFEYGLDCMDLAYNQSYSDTEIRSIVQDYLLNGNKEEAMNSLEKFRITADTMSRMMKDLIQLSLEGHSAGGLELGSQLVNGIVELEWIPAATLVNILEEIVDSLQDLSIDNPKIVEVIIPKAKKALLNNAMMMLSLFRKIVFCCRANAFLQVGHQSLDVLSAQFKMILKEYLHSNDKDVAGILAMEKMHDKVMTSLANLLKSMYEDGIIFESCIQKGYEKLYQSLSDLFLDLPAAYALARRWQTLSRSHSKSHSV
uniref:Programmed cell death protein 4 n=1 Tax=Ditylenchus dipsaci TaxID=166011 RepID=A0A915CWU8_9BILA